ncbi:hypothetical protein HELRODRAFT_159069 [Helobdella robusta]|uniref:Uncharacterized protein n=1 Tax=Helobdella robusta TaxID=6412 RepID=T1ENJ8_HELRO|nr:hypothetical protein HELRODRAFT_159069 [Helobdella robusta]ESO12517.1 hypothetical protein HELRODRAFT_159069 [Helobdella robusta]
MSFVLGALHFDGFISSLKVHWPVQSTEGNQRENGGYSAGMVTNDGDDVVQNVEEGEQNINNEYKYMNKSNTNNNTNNISNNTSNNINNNTSNNINNNKKGKTQTNSKTQGQHPIKIHLLAKNSECIVESVGQKFCSMNAHQYSARYIENTRIYDNNLQENEHIEKQMRRHGNTEVYIKHPPRLLICKNVHVCAAGR